MITLNALFRLMSYTGLFDFGKKWDKEGVLTR